MSKLFFVSGMFDLIVGVVDMRFDFDMFTYIWLITGIMYVCIGYALKKPHHPTDEGTTRFEKRSGITTDVDK